MFEDRFGITKIIDEDMDNLGISFDEGWRGKEMNAVFLFTPDMNDTREHYHIFLNRDRVKLLHDWLGQFLAEGVAVEVLRAEGQWLLVERGADSGWLLSEEVIALQ